MAKVRKYYWLKLQKDFFKRHDIRIIESMDNGKDYILFYLKLLVESIDHDGHLRFSESIPYDDKMLATITNTNIDTVRSAVKIFSKLELMETLDNETLYMKEIEKMTGSETEWAEKKRLQREALKAITYESGTFGYKNEDNVLIESLACPIGKNTLSDKSKSLEKEIELDIDNKEKNNKKEKSQPFEQYTGEKPKTHKDLEREKIAEIKNHWKTCSNLPQTKALDTNTVYSSNMLDVFGVFPNEDIIQAIDHLHAAYLSTDPKYRIKSFSNFMTVENVEKWYPEQIVEGQRELTDEDRKEIEEMKF